GTIKARNAVRDAARVLGYPYGMGDKIAKAMPPLVMGRDTPLKYCFEQSPTYADGYKAASELRAMYDTYPVVKRVVDVAMVLEGPGVFELMGRGDTMGVFQLESPPMRALLRSLAPSSFDDVGALIALYRPGPMSANMHYDYADRKNGRQPVEFFHPDAEELLA